MTDEQLNIEGVGSRRTRPLGRRQLTAKPADATDPLTAEQAKALLVSSSVIRDPVHHDIRVTKFELDLIDTDCFQRLRRINQLAMVDMVYPGAVHTRFLHSLGTLHVFSELVRACNNSVKALRPAAPAEDPLPLRIGAYAEFLGRLVALLHDIAHVPFGHVFEREAQVFAKDEWKDKWRLSQTLDPSAPFAVSFRLALSRRLASLSTKHALTAAQADSVAERVLNEVRDIVTASGNQVLRLRYPFIADLVGNTICADLLDYVQRDMYFCGLTEGLGKRFLNYLAVIPVTFEMPGIDADPEDSAPALTPNRTRPESDVAHPLRLQGDIGTACRAVFLYYRYNARRAPTTKDNVLSEAVDLVRTRKLVAEKLYFHKTKLAATSMLAAAAHASGISSAEQVWTKSDNEVLQLIRDGVAGEIGGHERAQRRRYRAATIARALLGRRLFKPLFRVSWHPDIGDPTGAKLWHEVTGVYARFRTPSGREKLIELMERAVEENVLREPGRGAGTVSISCPNRDMQLKPFQMLVLPAPNVTKIEPLERTVRPSIRDEIDVIKRQHLELWRLEVFVDPSVVDFASEFARKLAGAVEHFIGMSNELADFQGVPVAPIEELIRGGEVDRVLAERELSARITHEHRTQLVQGAIAARGDRDIETQLRDWGYLN